MSTKHLPTAAHFSLMSAKSSSLCEKIMTGCTISTMMYPCNRRAQQAYGSKVSLPLKGGLSFYFEKTEPLHVIGEALLDNPYTCGLRCSYCGGSLATAVSDLCFHVSSKVSHNDHSLDSNLG